MGCVRYAYPLPLVQGRINEMDMWLCDNIVR